MFGLKEIKKDIQKINDELIDLYRNERCFNEEFQELKRKFDLLLTHLNLEENHGGIVDVLYNRHSLKGFKEIEKCEFCNQKIKNKKN